MQPHCSACGGSLKSFRQFLRRGDRPTFKCEACGIKVRLRHWKAVLAIKGVLLLLLFGTIAVLDTDAAYLLVPVSALVLYLFLEYWIYRNMPWDPVQAPAKPAGPLE